MVCLLSVSMICGIRQSMLCAKVDVTQRISNAWLGHSDITTTMNVYGHVLGGDMDRLGQVMDTLLFKPDRAG